MAVVGLDFTHIDNILEALIVIAPAMVANATPLLVKGKRPVDGGRVFLDGRRILGDGKTWEGSLAGFIAGSLTALILAALLGWEELAVIGSAASLGAILGDMAGSFIKRRLGLKRGAPAPLLDQLDFYFGALALTVILGVDWSLKAVVEAAIVVVIAHVASNFGAYLMGIKNVPW
ncbi:MAG: CDP-2,3-bis-(O-geranylgeranyl)-sn-glycerol synthase [Desulfurococcales archaeon]|nr:CDP-2,3-bis-(O-geranylgeranyl)-sn-glycerol synthase [Desulfurococcales archaeon]